MKSIVFILFCFVSIQCSSPPDSSDLPEVPYQSSRELLVVSPNHEHLFVLDRTNSARLVSLKNGNRIIPLVGHQKAITNAVFSLDGTQVVTTSMDQTARLWSIPLGNDSLKPSLVLQGHQDTLLTAAFGPDGKKLATASADGTIQIWDTMTGEQKLILKGHKGAVVSVAISPTGTSLVSGGSDHKLMIWDLTTGRLKISVGNHTSPVQSIQFRKQPFLTSSPIKIDLILSMGIAGETFLWTYDEAHLNFIDSLKDKSGSPSNMKLAQIISATDTPFDASSHGNSIVLGISQNENGNIRAWKVDRDKTNDKFSVSSPTLVLQQPDSIESFSFWDGHAKNLQYVTTLDSSGIARVFYGAAILENQALMKEDLIIQISEKASLAQFLTQNQLLTATVSQGAVLWQVGSRPPPRDIKIQVNDSLYED